MKPITNKRKLERFSFNSMARIAKNKILKKRCAGTLSENSKALVIP
ncbi:hypothetical protein LPTSP2_06580 [Leptospira ellinghausenii]|uniref:Uncharacterized protein n=1 Tax=Leptospira ellinghausenii TaxID=1917822 RepID=A0A2P2D9R9_9LEPT|nr:hypothetical protein LPTSP2_06580 [Leptospira ellinghausenii]